MKTSKEIWIDRGFKLFGIIKNTDESSYRRIKAFTLWRRLSYMIRLIVDDKEKS